MNETVKPQTEEASVKKVLDQERLATANWTKRNHWLLAALLFFYFGTISLLMGSQMPDPYPIPMGVDPLTILQEQQTHFQQQTHKLISIERLGIFAFGSWFKALPIFSIPLVLAWRWRRRWPLRILTMGAFVFMLYGSYCLIMLAARPLRNMKYYQAEKDEIFRNRATAKTILIRLRDKEQRAKRRFTIAERQLSKTDVTNQLTLTTLTDLKARQQLLQEAIAAGKAVEEQADIRLAEFERAGIAPLGSGAQAAADLQNEQGEQENQDQESDDKDELENSEVTTLVENYAIKLQLLNLTQRMWTRRQIDRQAGKVKIVGDPEGVRQYQKLLHDLATLEGGE